MQTHPSDQPQLNTMHFDIELDTQGLNCPLPILKAKKALSSMSSGQVLKVISTDRGSTRDFAAFCKQTGHELLKQEAADSLFTHFLKHR
jgi:tRNA 2-thiouridine synthesizing protein A